MKAKWSYHGIITIGALTGVLCFVFLYWVAGNDLPRERSTEALQFILQAFVATCGTTIIGVGVAEATRESRA
jgi:hypothetical protein